MIGKQEEIDAVQLPLPRLQAKTNSAAIKKQVGFQK